LDGAKALALPSSFGQDLAVSKTDKQLIWKSYTLNKELWFEAVFDSQSLAVLKTSSIQIANTLKLLLEKVKELNPTFKFNASITTNLDFPRDWGLGTSSTLVNNLAQWTNTNAFELLQAFGGSGYDIACAQNDSPLFYQLVNEKPLIKKILFEPDFSEQLYFVHRNQKQNSKAGIKHYRSQKIDNSIIKDITSITNELVLAKDLSAFEYLLQNHETIIANLIKIKPIQQLLFKDYFGQIKSLGAWGGDFILVTGNEDTPNYFKAKGFDTIIPYKKMIL
jgi:mevalonate kinase